MELRSQREEYMYWFKLKPLELLDMWMYTCSGCRGVEYAGV